MAQSSAFIAAIAAFGVILAAGPASAQEGDPDPALGAAEQKPHYIDFLGSYVHPDSGRDTRSRGYGGTFIYGANLTGPFWIEGRLMGSLFETGTRNGTDFYHYGGGIDLVATVGDRTGWTPFALLGVGGVQNDVQPDRKDSFDIRGDFGVGLVSPEITSRGLKLRAEGRGLVDSYESGQFDWQVSLGISIPLGRQRVVERVVERVVVREVTDTTDSDLDGVIDSFDQCPSTLPDALVDSTGCLIREGQTLIVSDIHFEFDSARLTPGSEQRLDEIVASLRIEEGVAFEVAGHTDSMGSEAYNERLSQARALSVMRYLVGRGLDRDRITARGYGELQPIDTNESEDGRAKNRRVEFRFRERSAR